MKMPVKIPNVVLYHRDWDGVAAAWVADRFLGHPKTFISVQYKEPIPEIEPGSDVFILDFSYPRDQLVEIQKAAHSLVVLDHHKTAEVELKGFPCASFDLAHSGAQLTWNHFFGDKPVPLFIQYIEDHDLFKFILPDSKTIRAFIRSFPQTLESCSGLVGLMDSFDELGGYDRREEMLIEGSAILRYQERLVESAVDHASEMDLDGYKILHTQCSDESLISLVGARLAENRPFGMTWFYHAGRNKWICSLRSVEEGLDVGFLAKRFGGGGHVHAAGFELSFPPIWHCASGACCTTQFGNANPTIPASGKENAR
jgi:uncharacterized protein